MITGQLAMRAVIIIIVHCMAFLLIFSISSTAMASLHHFDELFRLKLTFIELPKSLIHAFIPFLCDGLLLLRLICNFCFVFVSYKNLLIDLVLLGLLFPFLFFKGVWNDHRKDVVELDEGPCRLSC